MSLTNPNTPVSQQDLQDFYHKLLPYMGGGSGGGADYTAGDGIDITDDTISIDPMPTEDMDDVIDELPTGGNIAVTGYVPLGTLIPYYGETAPKFFLACDGATYNKADYPELAKHLLSLTNNTPYIVDGDNTKFKVPDLRGEFIRGTGNNGHSGEGNGAGVGVHQSATVHKLFGISSSQAQAYGFQDPNNDWYQVANKDKGITKTLKVLSLNGTVSSTTSTADNYTSRPTNTSVLFCIAYKDIYSNPMNDYSTDEKVVGTWINGKTLYQKTIDFGALPNATTKTVAHNITNMDKLVNLQGCFSDTNGQMATIPFSFPDGATYNVGVYATTTIIAIKTGTDRSSQNAYVTIQYTKTTD